LSTCLTDYLSGKVEPQPQNEQLATKSGRLRKGDGLLDPTMPAESLARKVRAYDPWPGTYLAWDGGILKVLRAHATAGRAAAGTRSLVDGDPAFGTNQGWLVLDQVQSAGRKSMSGEQFLRGARNWET